MDYSVNPAMRNRLVDSALDLKTLKRNGLAQRIATQITLKTGGAIVPDDLICRFYVAKNGETLSAHLEVHYRDKNGQQKQFEKFGSHVNRLGLVENGKIKFEAWFIDDLPLTPEQKRYFEAVLEPFGPAINPSAKP